MYDRREAWRMVSQLFVLALFILLLLFFFEKKSNKVKNVISSVCFVYSD